MRVFGLIRIPKKTHMLPEEPARSQEVQEVIDSINGVSKLIVEERDPARFKVLVRELDELLQRETNRRELARELPSINPTPQR